MRRVIDCKIYSSFNSRMYLFYDLNKYTRLTVKAKSKFRNACNLDYSIFFCCVPVHNYSIAYLLPGNNPLFYKSITPSRDVKVVSGRLYSGSGRLIQGPRYFNLNLFLK